VLLFVLEVNQIFKKTSWSTGWRGSNQKLNKNFLPILMTDAVDLKFGE